MGKPGTGPKLRKRQSRALRHEQRVKHDFKPEWFPIYEDVVAGLKVREVAAKHGVHRNTVSKITAEMDKKMSIEMIDRVRDMKARHTAALEHVRQEAMAAWERSKLDAMSTTETTGGESGGSLSTTNKGQCGNPAYLETAMAAMDRQRKIWGADAPPKMEGELLIRVAGRPLEDVNRELLDRLEVAKARLIESTVNVADENANAGAESEG